MTTPGNPDRKSKLLQVRLTPELAKRARELSAVKGQSVSTITRHALVTALCEHADQLCADVRKRREDAARAMVEAFAGVDADELRKALKTAGRDGL